MSETTTAPVAQATAAPSATFAFTKLIVSDLDGAVDFYARVLGLVVAQTIETDDMAERILAKPGQQGGANVILYQHKDGRRSRSATPTARSASTSATSTPPTPTRSAKAPRATANPSTPEPSASPSSSTRKGTRSNW